MAKTLHLRTISRKRIKPETADTGTIHLNPLDHFESLFLVEVVFFYSHTLDANRLQQSLQQTLQEYPLLCGQMRRTSVNSLFVQYPHEGALFCVCECDRSFAEISSGLHETYNVYTFIEKINPFFLLTKDRPLATFKLTQMKGGGSALGISFSHALTDAYSYYYFIKHWSQVHEGLPTGAPLHDRSLLTFNAHTDSRSLSSSATRSPTCRGFRRLSSWQMLKLFSNILTQQSSVVCRVLRFTQNQVLAIKKAAGQLGQISTNDALSAHLWQFCTKLNKANNNNVTCKLLIPADLRSKMEHPRSEHYFGNVMSHIELSWNRAELIRTDLSTVAYRCRQKVAALDTQHLREQMLWLGENERRKQLFRVYADVDPYAGDCVTSNLSRLPVYEAQFDGEKPYWVTVPPIPAPWVMWFYPVPDGSGGIDVHTHIPRSASDKLKHDEWQSELYKYGAIDDTQGKD